jgi:hypothetical protein
MKTVYQLTVREQSGAFYELHRHHSTEYLQELAEVYQKHGYSCAIGEYLA